MFSGGPWALYGIWGGLVREWLHEILPDDAAAICRDRVNIVCRKPFASPQLINDFRSRDDLIDACMASAHVPLFMDGRFTARFRDGYYIDNDVFALRREASPVALPADAPAVRMSCGKDPRIREQGKTASMKLVSKESIHEMMTWGAEHVAKMDEGVKLAELESLRLG